VGIVAGIGLYASVYHLLVGVRQHPRNPINIIFALLILPVAVQILADGITRMSGTLSLVVISFKIGITLAAPTAIASSGLLPLIPTSSPAGFYMD
jgi:hypothetical protein